MQDPSNTAQIDNLVQTYFNSRPNRDLQHGKLAVLFLASSGAGKSTIREMVVNELGATYVCNDEVRALLSEQGLPLSNLKPIVDKVWQKLTTDSANHFIIFDSNLSSYYMHEDSYYHLVQQSGYTVYIVALDLGEDELKKRINGRERDDREDILNQLPDQLIAQHKAMAALHPDFVVTADSDPADLVKNLRQAADSLTA